MRTLTFLFVAFAALGIGTFFSYRSDIIRARTAVSEGSHIAMTAAGPIEYGSVGDGPPLLSIHGAGGGFDQGLALASVFFDQEYRVIAPSRFGYLATPVPPEASPAAQADAHAALMAALNIDRAVVVGVSAGARSAIELALRHSTRVDALVLLVPGTYAPDSPVSIEGSRGSKLAFRLVNTGADFIWWAMEKLAPDVLIRFLGVPPAVVAAASKADQDRVMNVVRSIEPLSRRFLGINIDSAPELKRLPLEEVAARTLIISARDDLFNTRPAAEFAAGLIPGARLIIFEKGGHLLVGHEAEVRTFIRDFIADAARAPK